MIIPEDMTAETLDELEVMDDMGQPVAHIGLTTTLYLEQPHDAGVRQRVAGCIDEYIQLVREHLRWCAIGGKRPLKVSEQYPGSVVALISHLTESDSFEMAATGAPRYNQASHYNIHTLLGLRRQYRRLGYLSATFPFRFLKERPGGFFQQFVHKWCERLSPLHGYAGLGLLRSMENSEARAVEPLIFPLVRRFPGLEIDMPHLEARLLADGIKGVNWLTMLSDLLLSKLGGADAVRQKLQNGFTFDPYPGGLMIQAGPHPEFGDLDRNIIPAHYRRLYEVLRPVQAPYDDVLMDTPAGVDPEAFTQQWLRRFATPTPE